MVKLRCSKHSLQDNTSVTVGQENPPYSEKIYGAKETYDYVNRCQSCYQTAEGHYPQADYVFDQRVLTRLLTQLIEASGKHWVSEIEVTRLSRIYSRFSIVLITIRTIGKDILK